MKYFYDGTISPAKNLILDKWLFWRSVWPDDNWVKTLLSLVKFDKKITSIQFYKTFVSNAIDLEDEW
jgi:hypothetical protein